MPDNPSQNITRTRADLSQFLIHLTKNGSFRVYEPFSRCPGHYLFKGGPTVEAKDSLIKIVESQTIFARSPFGHFQYQIPVGYQPKSMMPLEWLQSVCFSEAPISELRSFYEATKREATRVNKYQKYGLAFSQNLVRSRGGHPLFYFDSNNSSIVDAVNAIGLPANRQVTKPILPLFESFGRKLHSTTGVGSTDYRWEREWRHVGDFTFQLDEVSFGLCPETEIPSLEGRVNGAFPFVDPDWDQEKIRSHFLRKGFSHLADAV